MARIAINGLGRIGRTILRILTTTHADSDLEIVALNDIAGPEHCAYLMKYDSVFGLIPARFRTRTPAYRSTKHHCP